MIKAFFGYRRWAAWAYGAGALLILGLWYQVHLSVLFNLWYQGFYDLLQNVKGHTLADFNREIVKFLWIAMPWVVVNTVTNYLSRVYSFQWRTAITQNYLPRWAKVTTEIEGSSQRIQDDAFRFSRILSYFGQQAVQGVLTVVAFLPILWQLSKGILGIPGSLVWVALVTTLGGLGMSLAVGRKLVGLEYQNQVVEAEFRKQLVYGEDDKQSLSARALAGIWSRLTMNYNRLYLNFGYYDTWMSLFQQGMVVVPYLLAAPGLFTGVLTLGVVFRIADAFSQVQGSFSILINNFETITEFRSIWQRLHEFERNLTYDRW